MKNEKKKKFTPNIEKKWLEKKGHFSQNNSFKIKNLKDRRGFESPKFEYKSSQISL